MEGASLFLLGTEHHKPVEYGLIRPDTCGILAR